MRESRKSMVDQKLVERRRELITEHLKVLAGRPEGVKYGELFAQYEMAESTDASEYYVLEDYKTLIPVTETAHQTVQMFAAFVGDWSITTNTEELPVVEKAIVRILEATGYEVQPAMRHILKTKPTKVMTPMEEEAHRDAKKRRSVESRKKYYPTGKIDLDIV